MKFKDFLASKNIEDVAALDAEKQAELYNEYNEQTKAELEKAIENKASKEDIAEIKAELSANVEKQMNALNGVLKAQGVMLKRLSEGELKARTKSWTSELREQLEANKEVLDSMKTSKSASANFTVKAAGVMTIAGNVSGGNVPVEDRLEGLNVIPQRSIRLLDVMAKRTTMSNVVSWVYQANKDGAAGQTAEGALKNQIDFDLVVASESIKKTTAFIKVSTEMLSDIEWMASEIQNELTVELLKAVEAQVYSGDGLGQNLNGIRTVASAFAPSAAFALSVDNANIVDVLVAASDQIEVAEQPTPDYVFMHPSDVNFLKVQKVSATDKRYVERLSMVGNTLMLDGTTAIIKTTLVAAGEYLIGYFPKSMLVDKGGITFDIGLDSDDFSKNLRTVLAEWRGLAIVKNNDRPAFVKGVFATDIAAIETP